MLFFIVIILFLFSFTIFYRVNLAEIPFFGNYFLYTVDAEGKFKIKTTNHNASELLSAAEIVLGEGYEFNREKVSLKEILEYFDAEVVSECRLDGVIVKNCFSPRLAEHIMQGEKRVNLQIAITNETIKIGYPLILDSF